ncbi:Efflux pump vrtL [Sparassis crispa]|uniref:Efflux pump vrtL n=1 Tax=Sparassis crispa TaxID=139825 RepID=A0A401GTJ5_9APHY|nr:Efflux pump vrtL [Sparassis crispa]GBE85551.1 Efflux pump vrtL [Sparassis crispa]
MNWSYRRKWAATVVVSAFAFITPVTSSIIAPASLQLTEHFGIGNSTELACVTSIFVLAYAFGPLLLGPLSELYGRSRVLQLANLWYLAWNIGCGLSQNTSQIMAFRFLAGLGGSAPLSIGGGVLADCWKPEERGKAIALYSVAPVLGPVIGPVVGAWIAQKSTWRWVFYSTSIADAVIQVLGLFFLKESFAPLLLARKANELRKNPTEKAARAREIRSKFDNADREWKSTMARALRRPLMLFIHEPIVQLLGVYFCFVYGLLYIFLTTMPSIFELVYRETVGIAGLNYFALGVGLVGAAQLNALMLDKLYKHLMQKHGGEGKPEYRLPSMIPGTLLTPIGLLISGWTAKRSIHWVVPDIGIALVGAGTILNFISIQTYVVDAFSMHAASALAAITFLRSLAGFGFPLFAPSMYTALGYGKGNSILAAVGIVVGCPAPFILWFYGERIRKASKFARH